MTAIQARQSNNAAPSTDTTLPALTGLRGVAALVVVWVHVHKPIGSENFTTILDKVLQFGWVGVPLFFILSGFLITWLALQEIESTGRFHLRAFLLRRSLRIMPLYFFVVTLGLAAAHAPLHLLSNLGVPGNWAFPLLTFTTNFAIAARHTAYQLNGLVVLWSLSAEIQFYIIWSICLKLFTRKRLEIIAMAGLALSFAVRLTSTESDFFIYREQAAVSLGSLMMGCLAALFFDSTRKALRHPRRIEPVLVAAIFATTIAACPTPESTAGKCALITAIDIECALLLLLAAHSRGSLARLFKTKGLQFAGEISYPLYVFHPIVIAIYDNALHHFHIREPHSWLRTGLEYIVIILITAAVSTLWNTIEKPLRRLRRRSAAH